jgi:HSP20 family protein
MVTDGNRPEKRSEHQGCPPLCGSEQPASGPGITGFFALPAQRAGMTGLGAALRSLPDAVFADLLESDDAYLLVLDVPGVTGETLDLTVATGSLHVEAHREKPDAAGYRFVEEQRDAFLDVDLPLPPDANADDASASIERGVLEVTIPRRSATTVTEIEVEDA